MLTPLTCSASQKRPTTLSGDNQDENVATIKVRTGRGRDALDAGMMVGSLVGGKGGVWGGVEGQAGRRPGAASVASRDGAADGGVFPRGR